jgi:catechol 2,3-dioxygenase-like lactoylglutathione lyase family enzyme
MHLTFDHVAQQVPNIAEAVEWYRALIPDVSVLYQDDSWAFLDANGTKLAFVKKDQHPNHLAWRVSNADLEELAEKFGKTIVPHRDKTRSFYLEAPGGQWIEIICTEEATWLPKDDDLISNK